MTSNGSASGTGPRPRNATTLFNDAATLINRGGLGTASHTQADSRQTSQASEPQSLNAALDIYEAQFFPGQPKSLSGIALRSFILGLVLSSSLALSSYLIYTAHAIWRAPFFISVLSIFHFLEFYTTSRANTTSAKISSFLFSSNGSAYTIAHSASLLETTLTHLFLPSPLLSPAIHTLLLVLGLLFVIIGQSVRATAMLTAGTNFSHVVRHTKAQSHQLVTGGIYSVLRHPSYFGFFWWGIGTQLVCGNAVCFVGYLVALWLFFARRVEGEEELLVGFFGDEYVKYRARTWVGIPFIG